MSDHPSHHASHPQPSYFRFAAMVATATACMYVLTYSNTFRWDHVFFSEERLYMVLLMGGMMAIIMLSFMLPMYRNRAVNISIYAGSALLIAAAFTLIRTQWAVEDVAYMKSMIPHHSIAILTSERARIDDPRVRALADEIAETQRQEIAEMKSLIHAINAHGVQDNPPATRPAATTQAAP